MERLPDSWPMARLAITLDGLAAQLSKVVMTATMEITASCRTPNSCLPCLTQLAKDVTIALALHLADLVANWLCGILEQQAVLLFNESTAGPRSPNAAPATKSDTPRSPNTAPATN